MSFIKTRKKIVSSALLSSLSIASGTVIAGQDATNLPTISAHGQEESLKVEKSANSKYLVPLLDTAKSVDVISSKLINDTQVTTLSDALRTVPGITLGAGEGGNPNGDRPFIRGYNSESSIYVDGVRNATSQQREMFDVEQVEVTKGSASTLGGGGSTGGSINMITKLPKLTDAVQGSISSGTNDYRRIVLDGNKNFDNGIAGRVVVMGHQNTKAGQKDGAEYNRVGIAPSIVFGTNSPTKATLSYYYLRTNDTPDSGVPYNNPTGTGVYGKPVDVKQGIYYGLHNRDFQKQENQIGTFKLEHTFDNGFNLANIVTYSRSKNDYLWTQPDDSQGDVTYGKVWRRANSSITDTETFADQLVLQGKLNTGSVTHRLSLGADFSHQATDKGSYGVTSGLSAAQSCGTGTNQTNSTYGIGTSNGYCTSLYNPNSYDAWSSQLISGYTAKTTTKDTGLYILDNIEFTPQWLLDLGVRWDNFNTKQNTYASVSSTAYTLLTTPTTVVSKTDFFSYTAGLTYKPVEQGSIYASFATSANPVGISAGDGSETISTSYKDLEPETARTFEVGTKWDLFDRRANVTAAVFRTEKQNTRIAVSPTQYTNGGASRVNGFELGLNGNITANWDISLGYSYLDAIQSGNPGVSTRDGSAIQTRGKQLPNVPKNSATLWSTYKITPKLTLGGGVVASDKVYGNTTNTLWVSGYTRYDLMARYAVNKNIDVQLNVNNVSNTRYFTKAYASHYATEAEGRNGVLTVNFKY
ncbi:TonB-dependent receptor [Acinetobacter rathckeae]|uniref:TonB-dependent receptor n=1 Tax=Acinetobacter rathckeae TaxID=2605272 RepID=UPI0018A295B7|nr:TonB-dependent siderophore receptor [Acinetobacter rathckeae]MBF7696414.1 TonB-dependent siderophore receptor [Acinetobacter rathckeae]